MGATDTLAVSALLSGELSAPPKEVWFAIRADNDAIGAGTIDDPYAVNTADSFADRVNQLRIASPDGSYLIHLGPGAFRTRGSEFGNGFSVDAPQLNRFWTLRQTIHFVGAGIYRTILQFVWDIAESDLSASNPAHRHYMLRSLDNIPLVPFFEMHDLTLDLNLQGTPYRPHTRAYPLTATWSHLTGQLTVSSSFFTAAMLNRVIQIYDPTPDPVTNQHYVLQTTIASVLGGPAVTLAAPVTPVNTDRSGLLFWVYDGLSMTVTGFAAAGDHLRIRRVRVINGGTRTPPICDGMAVPTDVQAATYEGFPLRFGGRDSLQANFNAVCEACLIEQPFPQSAREVTALVAGGGVLSSADRLHIQFETGCNVSYDMVPVPQGSVYGDLLSLGTLPGQSSQPPAEKAFGTHFIVRYGGIFYDPSYGVTYDSAASFDLSAVAGFFTSVGFDCPNGKLRYRARKNLPDLVDVMVYGPIQ